MPEENKKNVEPLKAVSGGVFKNTHDEILVCSSYASCQCLWACLTLAKGQCKKGNIIKSEIRYTDPRMFANYAENNFFIEI